MNKQKTALVLGAGGFIGSHMVKRLKSEGYWVRGVDLKHPEFSMTEADQFITADLRLSPTSIYEYEINEHGIIQPFRSSGTPFCVTKWFDEVYQFAADMGGAGYIFTGEHDADVMHNSVQINLNVVSNLRNKGCKIFYSSSACMYPQELQNDKDAWLRYPDPNSSLSNDFYESGLKESDAYPANPDSEYGWEKLFSERLYLAHARNYGLNVRIARFHNIYGPAGTYKGGKEKAPAAMCRKIVEAKLIEEYISDGDYNDDLDGIVEVWGPGDQTRSFLYIDDCIDAVRLLMESDFKEPINIGSEEMISINDLAKMVIGISGKYIEIKNIPGPTGVRGRNSDNTLIREKLNWEPKYKLYDGMVKTYAWIAAQVHNER